MLSPLSDNALLEARGGRVLGPECVPQGLGMETPAQFIVKGIWGRGLLEVTGLGWGREGAAPTAGAGVQGLGVLSKELSKTRTSHQGSAGLWKVKVGGAGGRCTR